MRIGIDLGGTKIEGVALAATGVVAARRRVPTPQGDYEGTVRAIVDLVRSLERETGGEASVGMGMPGIISPATGLVKNANSVCLNGRPLDRDLAMALGREVRIENDSEEILVATPSAEGVFPGPWSLTGTVLKPSDSMRSSTWASVTSVLPTWASISAPLGVVPRKSSERRRKKRWPSRGADASQASWALADSGAKVDSAINGSVSRFIVVLTIHSGRP